MTATDFLRHLEQPRLLYKLPLTELQQLAARFPYSANLRLLLLLKSHLDGHPEEANYLARCAASSFDRANIYDILRELDVASDEAPELEGDVLELRELDELMLDTMPVQQAQTTPLVEQLPEPAALDDFASGWEEELTVNEEVDEEQENDFAEIELDDASSDFEQEPEGSVAGDQGSAQEQQEVQKGEALTGYGTLQERLARIRQRQRAKGFDEKEDVNRIARRSLMAQGEVASETLAKLLVRQGQYQNAIKMYQRLILLYPEKKTTFASLIKDLKEKL